MKIKKIIAGVISAVIVTTFSCSPALAATIRADNQVISNCRTHPELRDKDKTFVLLKYAHVYIEGEKIYAGDIYGAEDYDIFGDDDVRCKVQSNIYDHYAGVTTKAENSVSADVKRGVSAYSDWTRLDGGNGDKGWANFFAGFIIY